MGTWGTGLFDSDLAEDFVDQLEKHSAGQRAELIRLRVNQAWAGPSDELPGEVLAAAAVVAAGLPSGRDLPWNEGYPGVTDWLRGTDVPELAAVADRALERHLPSPQMSSRT